MQEKWEVITGNRKKVEVFNTLFGSALKERERATFNIPEANRAGNTVQRKGF